MIMVASEVSGGDPESEIWTLRVYSLFGESDLGFSTLSKEVVVISLGKYLESALGLDEMVNKLFDCDTIQLLEIIRVDQIRAFKKWEAE